MKTVLITGIFGFLGRNLIKHFSLHDWRVIGIAHSEKSIKNYELGNNIDFPVHMIDISTGTQAIKNVIEKYSVDYIVHAAALKHIGLCENNPTRSIEVNILGSLNIIQAATDCKVKNVIGISTDKALNPSCTYGMTKNLMEKMFLENGFGIFQGVNFLFSDGSVLDIWDHQRLSNSPILANTTSSRYFSPVQDVCERIISMIESKKIFSVEKCYNINIGDLQKAFSRHYNYWNVEEYTPLEIEKNLEEIDPSINIINTNIGDVLALFNGRNK